MEEIKEEPKSFRIWLVLGLVAILAFAQIFDISVDIRPGVRAWLGMGRASLQGASGLEETVLPSDGIILPIMWDDLGKRMVEAGVIDKEKFEALYAQRGGLTEGDKKTLYGERNGKLIINAQNSGFLLNLLWAFGLSNQNRILEEGPMVQYDGDAGRFASTGGWTLAVGNTMDHYSAHAFVELSEEHQELVERVSKNIYRPCCGNSVYFPDCNHGMAMLGLLELLAAQNVSEEEMYKLALRVNSYWFPDTYLTIAKYFEARGVSWDEINPKGILGSAYSSASGYQQIRAEVEPAQSSGGGGCGA